MQSLVVPFGEQYIITTSSINRSKGAFAKMLKKNHTVQVKGHTMLPQQSWPIEIAVITNTLLVILANVVTMSHMVY